MAVVAGPVETTIPAEVRRGSSSGEQELLKGIVAGATLGRIGQPGEIAVTVVFLTSPESSCMTTSTTSKRRPGSNRRYFHTLALKTMRRALEAPQVTPGSPLVVAANAMARRVAIRSARSSGTGRRCSIR
jgi:Enoyl-(Acyl carrier protein) reductase